MSSDSLLSTKNYKLMEEPPPSSSSSAPLNDVSTRKELVKARWGILRNALLQSSPQHQRTAKHSIHRFSGYNLLEARTTRTTPSDSSLPTNESNHIRRIEALLTEFRWDGPRTGSCPETTREDQLEIAILALAACFPKGKCLRIIGAVDETTDSFSDACLESIKQRCQPCVCVWKVSQELETPDHKDAAANATMVTTLLVQESSNSTKYHTLFYDLEHKENSKKLTTTTTSIQNDNKENDNGGGPPSLCHKIWTREPKENRLSLDDLVSHRKNDGVDNTGNICVWDSERTLAYLLYHHLHDFSPLIDSSMLQQQTIVQDTTNHQPAGIRILELGTGMAGLSAVALGIRLAMQQPEHAGKTTEKTQGNYPKSIHVTLTDGNASGVKNNVVNQHLTKLQSQVLWQQDGTYSHYLDLDVHCTKLLWTTDLRPDVNDRLWNQDVVLVSDCVHFQNFHAALAITTLRCLRVGASAIFCQPTRGSSLANFHNLLATGAATTTSEDDDDTNDSRRRPLLSIAWQTHPIIEQKHQDARTHFQAVYDESLHHPKLLVVTKLRELSHDDRVRFVDSQNRYSPIRTPPKP